MQGKEPRPAHEPAEAGPGPGWVSTRLRDAKAPDFDPSKPRLGRRESEPHSDGINYLYDVLCTNFPEGRVTWDLHHYFELPATSDTGTAQVDLQFDVSFFKDYSIPHRLSSYKASSHGGRVPDMAVNILSKSTWHIDLSAHLDTAKLLNIPLYIAFPTYHSATLAYKPPFLRASIRQPDGSYEDKDLRAVLFKEGEEILEERLRDPSRVLDTTAVVPFRVALMQREPTYEGGLPTFHVILLHANEPLVYLTRYEKEKARADEEKARADEMKARADEMKARADEMKARADEMKARADNLQRMLDRVKEQERE